MSINQACIISIYKTIVYIFVRQLAWISKKEVLSIVVYPVTINVTSGPNGNLKSFSFKIPSVISVLASILTMCVCAYVSVCVCACVCVCVCVCV